MESVHPQIPSMKFECVCCKSNNLNDVRCLYILQWEYFSGLNVNLCVLIACIFTFSPRRGSYLTETSAHTSAAVLHHRSKSEAFGISETCPAV